jgi:hypothetical protein
MMAALKGMTGALAPFSYLVSKIPRYVMSPLNKIFLKRAYRAKMKIISSIIFLIGNRRLSFR